MVRIYTRKREKRDNNLILRAVRDIEVGMPIRAAARKFGMSDRTLRRHIAYNARKQTDKSPIEAESMPLESIPSEESIVEQSNFIIKNAGRQAIFTTEEEQALEEYFLHSSDIYFGLSAIEGRKLAFQFAMKQQKAVPENWINNEMSGPDWLQGFMQRHPKLSLRKPEATSVARASAFNRANVSSFFELYIKVSRNIKFAPQNIWNIDETGLTTVHKPDRVISRRGCKQVGQITSSERGYLVSMALAVNAAGMRAPPYFVFPRAQFRDYFLNGGPNYCWGGANPSGFFDSAHFLEFIKKFQEFTRCTLENPILLLMDNYV